MANTNQEETGRMEVNKKSGPIKYDDQSDKWYRVRSFNERGAVGGQLASVIKTAKSGGQT